MTHVASDFENRIHDINVGMPTDYIIERAIEELRYVLQSDCADNPITLKAAVRGTLGRLTAITK